MPKQWIENIIKSEENPEIAVKHVISQAIVSPIAAVIRLINILPEGYIFCNLSSDGTVVYSGRSDGTLVNKPIIGEEIKNPKIKYPYSQFVYSFVINGQQFL